MNIFNISRELEDIFNQIEENGGEITPELEERLAINEELLHDKLDSYRRIHSKFLADAKICKEEETRIAKLRKTKENQAERLKAVMLDAVQKYGATGKSGNKLVNLPDAKLYTKSSMCTEVDANLACILKDCFLSVFKVSWTMDTLEESSYNDKFLIKLINETFYYQYPDTAKTMMEDKGHLFTVDDLEAMNLEFKFSFNLNELNRCDKGSLLKAWFDNADFQDKASCAIDINKTNLKNRILDANEISIGSVIEHEVLMIK